MKCFGRGFDKSFHQASSLTFTEFLVKEEAVLVSWSTPRLASHAFWSKHK
jgi:hypothetical protein